MQLLSCLLRPSRSHELFFEEVLEPLVADPGHRILKSGRWRGTRSSLRDYRRSQRQGMERPCLLKATGLIKMTVEDSLGLADELITFFAIKGVVESRYAPPATFDAIKKRFAPRVDATKEQEVDGAIFDG